MGQVNVGVLIAAGLVFNSSLTPFSPQNANAALQLNFTDPIRTFEQLKASTRASSKLDGDALYKQMIEDAVERTKVGTCFVAGTLVHTQTGLVPIEQIKVGDYVLSKPESGEGELSYQKVTQTFVHENQPILCVVVYPERLFIEAKAENRLIDESQRISLLVTPTHPFWVEGKGWVDAIKLRSLMFHSNKLRLADGSLALICDVHTVMRMDNPNLGWLMDGVFCPRKTSDDESEWVDLSNNQVIHHYEPSEEIENNFIEWWDQNPEDRLLRTVYNIEVENTHTYFVGNEGVWVHNKNAALRGEALDVALAEARNNILPPHGTRAYFTEGEARKQFTQKLRADTNRDGVVLIGTKYDATLSSTQFQMQAEGSVIDKGLTQEIKDGVPTGNKIPTDLLLEFSYLYQNPFTGGRDFIMSGDGRAKIYEWLGKKLDTPIYSRTTIDAKEGIDGFYRTILDRPILQKKFVQIIKKTTAALQQNKDYSHVIEFEDPVAVLNLVKFLKGAVTDPKWREYPKAGVAPGWNDADWFSENIYLSLAGTATKQPDGQLRRILSDDLIGFKKMPDGSIEVIGEIKEIRNALGDIIGLDIVGGVKKADILKPAEGLDSTSFFKDVVNLVRQANDKYQTVSSQGVGTGVASLSAADITALLPAARQYWLNAGASPFVLDNVAIAIAAPGALPPAVAGQTTGRQITLSGDGAGWGWFVDTTTTLAEEFTTGSDGTLSAVTASRADGRLDLLSVLIHEIGHVLGLNHETANDVMNSNTAPGLRRLPGADEQALLHSIAPQLNTTNPIVVPGNTPSVAPQHQLVVAPQLTNANFSQGTQGWNTEGAVTTNPSTNPTTITLSESSTSQTTLSQAFTLGAGDRYLSFTVDNNQNLASGGQSAPSDAFEVALLDATTYDPLLGKLGLTHSDALLNLQRNASGALVQRETAAVHSTTNADGSTTYTLDLRSLNDVGNASGIGRSVLLSFDLLGFGATDSTITLRNIHMSNAPQAVDDALTVVEDTPTTFNPLANDTDANQPGMVPSIVSSPQHGNVAINPDGSFTYTPNANYNGPDNFSYHIGPVNGATEGIDISNTATVGR